VILLPAIAFALVSVWTLEPALAVGVMILAACPGGVTSNLMTHLAKGDTALSVSLTAVISVLGVVTLPLIVGFAIVNFMDAASAPEISVLRISVGVFLITTVPVIIGMMVLAFYLANFAGLGVRQRTAITLELGLQNGTLAIFVAVTLIGNQTMMVPGGIYSLLMFVTAGIYLLPVFRREAGE
jgi:BASS family bile acid:Na+ symporter